MKVMIAMLRVELRRLLLRPWPWVLAAAVLGWLGWNLLLGLGEFLKAQAHLATLPAALLPVGESASAFTRQPVLAAALALALTLALWAGAAQGRAPQLSGPLLRWLSLPTHLQPMLRGLVATQDLAYFGILVALALSCAVQRLARERAVG